MAPDAKAPAALPIAMASDSLAFDPVPTEMPFCPAALESLPIAIALPPVAPAAAPEEFTTTNGFIPSGKRGVGDRSVELSEVYGIRALRACRNVHNLAG